MGMMIMMPRATPSSTYQSALIMQMQSSFAERGGLRPLMLSWYIARCWAYTMSLHANMRDD